MALADSRAFLNPLVVSFDHLLEIGVGKKARRDVSSKGADLGPLKLFQACLRLWIGCREMETAVRKTAESSQTPGSPLHMHWPITVASFRTWRGSQDYIARDPAPDTSILTFESAESCPAGPVRHGSQTRFNSASPRVPQDASER